MDKIQDRTRQDKARRGQHNTQHVMKEVITKLKLSNIRQGKTQDKYYCFSKVFRTYPLQIIATCACTLLLLQFMYEMITVFNALHNVNTPRARTRNGTISGRPEKNKVIFRPEQKPFSVELIP
jgi:hypothetical protein